MEKIDRVRTIMSHVPVTQQQLKEYMETLTDMRKDLENFTSILEKLHTYEVAIVSLNSEVCALQQELDYLHRTLCRNESDYFINNESNYFIKNEPCFYWNGSKITSYNDYKTKVKTELTTDE